MESVRVHLISVQSDGKNREKVDVMAKGKVWERDGIWCLAYITEAENPAERLRQQVELWPGRTIVKTKGDLESRMTFCLGKCLQADYRSPYGEFPIEVLTKKHQVKKDAEIGYSEIWLEYTLYLDKKYLADYQMKISIEMEK